MATCRTAACSKSSRATASVDEGVGRSARTVGTAVRTLPIHGQSEAHSEAIAQRRIRELRRVGYHESLWQGQDARHVQDRVRPRGTEVRESLNRCSLGSSRSRKAERPAPDLRLRAEYRTARRHPPQCFNRAGRELTCGDFRLRRSRRRPRRSLQPYIYGIIVCMKKTLHIDERLLRNAKSACGAKTDTDTVRLGLEALVRHGAYERLRALRGSEPHASETRRRRERASSADHATA